VLEKHTRDELAADAHPDPRSGPAKKGSPAYYRGTFSADGNTATGEWVYPGGGGYKSSMTRIG